MNQQRATELRKQMAKHICDKVDHWSQLPDLNAAERCDGVAFSILMMLDGGTELPAMMLVAVESSNDGVVINPEFDLHIAYSEERDRFSK